MLRYDVNYVITARLNINLSASSEVGLVVMPFFSMKLSRDNFVQGAIK